MEILCEVCKSKCMLIDGDYICQEGHVSKFVQEMTEDMDFMKVSRSLRKKKEENLYEDYDLSYKTLLMHNLLFCCLLESLGLKDEKYFQFFVNYLSGDRKKVYYDLKLDYPTLVVLLYLTKREEEMKSRRVFFFNSFADELAKISLKERVKHFKQLLVLRSFCINQHHVDVLVYAMDRRREILEALGDKGLPITAQDKLYKETGLRNPLVEYNKILFRTPLRLDLEYMLEYFKVLSDLFCIKVSSEMSFFFEKFVYMREYDKAICFPEDEVCFFFFLFNIHRKIQFNFQEAYKKVASLHQKAPPTREDLNNILFIYLRTTPEKFQVEVEKMLSRSGCDGHSRFFFGSFFHHRHLVDKRFKSLEIYIKRLKNLLKTKKHLRQKKEFVDSFMI